VTASAEFASALDAVHSLGPLILERADAAEQKGCLDDDVVAALFDRHLLHALAPSELGGLDLTIPEATELVRSLSTYDASVGWTYAIGVGGPLAGRLLARDAFEEIFGDPRAWMAGSLNPMTSKAEIVDGGYRLDGTAQFASGCRHATWLMIGGWVQREGKPSFIDGRPEMIAGIIPMSEVEVTDTWSVTGMRATGSNDCVIEGAFAPDERVFSWFGAVPRFETGPFGRIPLLMQFGPGLAATAVGAARGMQSGFIALATQKRPVGGMQTLAERSYGQMAAGEAEGLILAAEDALAAAVAEIWRRGENGAGFDLYTRVAFRMRLVAAVRLAGRAADLLHDAAGMHAIAVPSPLERAWRDVHVASQHVMLNVGRIEVAGRALLGLDPGPII
jgi:indole-3-acetate monooxygenase